MHFGRASVPGSALQPQSRLSPILKWRTVTKPNIFKHEHRFIELSTAVKLSGIPPQKNWLWHGEAGRNTVGWREGNTRGTPTSQLGFSWVQKQFYPTTSHLILNVHFNNFKWINVSVSWAKPKAEIAYKAQPHGTVFVLPNRWIWRDIRSLENMNSKPGRGIDVPSVAWPLPACSVCPGGWRFKIYSHNCQMEMHGNTNKCA